MKKDNFIITVSRKRKPESIASQMANVQEAILKITEELPIDNKPLNKLCREFSKLKGLMYGIEKLAEADCFKVSATVSAVFPPRKRF